MELVGIRVYDPSKEGLDAGELVGLPATGVKCTTDVDSILALRPDCINYSALGRAEHGIESTVQMLCRLLASGANVTSSALEVLVYPKTVPDVLAALEGACREGTSSFYDTGINPGYAMDLWPITISRLSRTVEQIRLTEVVDMALYDSSMVRTVIGMGRPPSERRMEAVVKQPHLSPFYSSVLQVADSMGVALETCRFTRETAVTEVDLEIAVGKIDAGTVAAIRMQFTGVVDGIDRFVNTWVWRVSDEVAPEWPAGDRWELEIVGDPSMHSVLEMSTTFGAGRAVSLSVATLNVNAIPTLCRVDPGVYTNLTLPNHAGGYLA
jgi:hypothetical protein